MADDVRSQHGRGHSATSRRSLLAGFGVLLAWRHGVPSDIESHPGSGAGGRGGVQVKNVRQIRLDAPSFGHVMAWSPDSRRLAVGGLLDKRMSVWDVRTGQRLPGPPDQSGGVEALAYSSDGRYLAVKRGALGQPPPGQTRAVGPERYVVSLWDAHTGSWVQNLPDEAEEIKFFGGRSMTFSPDSRRLAVTYQQIAFYENDGAAWRRIGALALGALVIAFSPDGNRLAGNSGQQIRTYEVPTGRTLLSWPSLMPAKELGYPSIAFSPDGSELAVGSGPHLALYDPDSGALRKTLQPVSPYQIYSLSYSSDGRFLAVAIARTVRIFETASWAEVASLKDHAPRSVEKVAFSPDGSLLAAVGGDVITLWELSR